MSQVLQWTQFCALMTKRGSLFVGLVGIDHFVDAGRAVEARRLAVDRQVASRLGSSGSARTRCGRLVVLVRRAADR